MFDFISEHSLFVLAVVGAVLSFVASFAGLVSKRKPIVFLAVLASLVFIVGITSKIYSFSEQQETNRKTDAEKHIKDAAQQARDGVIEEILGHAEHIRNTVDALADRFKDKTLADVGTKLVTIQTSPDSHFEDTAAFAKGSPSMWKDYADWLSRVAEQQVAPSLSLALGPEHHYKAGLLLAYLLTSAKTSNVVANVVKNHRGWHDFPAEDLYRRNFSPNNTGHLQWVLFYDGSETNLVAFADARAFARELMFYHRLGQDEAITEDLNRTGQPDALKKRFASIQTAIFETTTPSELVRSMIEQQLSISVATDSISVATKRQQPYVARLVSMIKLAASED